MNTWQPTSSAIVNLGSLSSGDATCFSWEYIRAVAWDRAMTGAGVDTAPDSGGEGANRERQHQRKPTSAQGGSGAVYGLGMIGALIWYWRHADSPRDRALGVLKAFVWPAFLVYEALEALQSNCQ